MSSRAVAAALASLLFFCQADLASADDATAGYVQIRPSIVQLQCKRGGSVRLATGFIVASSTDASFVLTAHAAVEGTDSISVLPTPEGPPVLATIVAEEPNYAVSLLRILAGSLAPVRFTGSADAPINAGETIAVAGFIQREDGETGHAATLRLRYPGTIAALPDAGRVLELTNIVAEDSLIGAPVFDPATGHVLGELTLRSADARSGSYAASAPAVLLRFLEAQHITPAR